MQIFSVFLINGFLLSITPSAVTDSKCSSQLPVIQEKCSDKPAPLMLPQPQPLSPNGTGDIKDNDEKKSTPPGCPDAKAC